MIGYLAKPQRAGFHQLELVLVPIISVQISALNGFGQVFGGNGFGVSEIGDGAGDTQHPVVSARG